MGNHSAGRAMGKSAALMLENRCEQSARSLLDAICKPWKGCDAEFEAEDPNNPGRIHPDYTFYTDPNGPLGVLILEVWGEQGVDYMETVEGLTHPIPSEEHWWEGPYAKFRERYDFR